MTPLPYGTDQLIDAAMARAARRRLPRSRPGRLGGALGSAGISGPLRGAAGDKRSGDVALPVIGRQSGRYPGDAAGRPGAIRTDASGSAGCGGDLVCGVGLSTCDLRPLAPSGKAEMIPAD